MYHEEESQKSDKWKTYLMLGVGCAGVATYEVKYKSLDTFSLITAVAFTVLAVYCFSLVKEELGKKPA